MPKTVFEKKPKHDKLMTLILGTAKVNGKRNPEIAKMAGVGEATIYARFKTPGNFTLDELTGIGRGLNIPIEELRQAITY